MIRSEIPTDIDTIHSLVARAFKPMRFSDDTEPHIIDALRNIGALEISLVYEAEGEIQGHIGFSKITINGMDQGWFGLGPVAVDPDIQRTGVGSTLIKAGLNMLADRGAKGCVLTGNPQYYNRFGFTHSTDLSYPDAPADVFLIRPFGTDIPVGTVAFHPAFDMETPFAHRQ